MSGFDTPIPWLVIAGWAAASALLLLARHALLASTLSRRTVWSITGLRLLALALAAVLLLQPYREHRVPDRDAFRTAVVLDASASMTVRDTAGGRSRLDVVRQAVGADAPAGPSLLDRLRESGRTDVYIVAETLRPWRPGNPLPVLPGRTALGAALESLLQDDAGAPLGSVLLLSDGHTNAGPSPIEVCKRFRARGVPVSCLGIGESRQPGDLCVRFAGSPPKGRKGEPLTLNIRVENRFDHPVATRLTLSDAQAVLAERDVAIPARGTREEHVGVIPLRAGYVSYRARVDAVPGDAQPETDVDYAAAQVTEPDRFRVLFLGAHLGWEFRFLRLVCDAHPQLSLAAVLQTGPGSFYQVGFGEAAEGRLDGFPDDPEVINRFDAVVLDARAGPALDARRTEALIGFVDRRGGGLLVLGPAAALPEPLREVLPVVPPPAGVLTARERLLPNPEFIFDLDPGRALDPAAGLPLPAGEPMWLAQTLKRGARSAATLRGNGLSALAAHGYGSGRIACLGIETTWRWRLASPAGQSSHSAFWNALLVWLSSTGKPRLRSLADGARAALGEPVPLDIHLLGSDFLPAPDARVTAAVTSPSGKTVETPLDPAADTPGLYSVSFYPEEPGEYRVAYRAEGPSGDFSAEAHFLARRTGAEMEDTAYREDVLRDMARITGGVFLPCREMDSLRALPLSRAVPTRVSRLYWSRNGVLLALLGAVLGAEWFLRRRVGLK